MEKQRISTATGAQPVGANSQGLRAVDFVFVSGQGPLDPKTGKADAHHRRQPVAWHSGGDRRHRLRREALIKLQMRDRGDSGRGLRHCFLILVKPRRRIVQG